MCKILWCVTWSQTVSLLPWHCWKYLVDYDGHIVFDIVFRNHKKIHKRSQDQKQGGDQLVTCSKEQLTWGKMNTELSNVSSEKLPRVAVILCLASCLIEGSSASSMSEIKHTALEGAGKTSASTIVVLEQQGLENADCRFCFSICQPHVVKMDCDRFCSGECPEDYIHLPFEDDMCLSMEVSEPAQKDNTFVGIIHVLVWPLLGCLVSYLVLDELELANGKRHYDCEETPVAGKLDKEQTSDSSYNEAVGDTSLSPGYKTNSCDNENQIGIEDSRSQQEIERNQILTADYNVKYRDIESYRNGSEKDHEENDEHKTEWCKYHRDCEETHVTGKRDEKHSVDSCYDEANLSTEEDPVFDKTNSCDNDDDIEVDLEGNTANCNVSDSERELCGNDLEKEHENEESKSEYLGKCHHDCEETHVIGIPDENQPDSSSYNAVGRETNLSSDDETNSCDNEDKIEIEDAQSQQDIEGNTANCNVSDLERESCGNYIGKEHENEENKAEYLGKVSLYKPAEEGIGEIHIHMITVCPMGVGKTCLSNQLFGQGLDIKTRTIAQAKNVVMRRFSILPYQHNKVWVMHHTGRNQHKQNQTDNKPISPQSSSAADRIFSKFHTTHKYKILSVNRDNKEDIDDLKSQTVLSTKISQNLKAIQMALQFMTPLEVVKPFNNPMLYKSSELFETPSQVEHKERRILSAYKQQQHGFRIAVGIRTFKVVKYFQKDSYYQTDHSPPIGNSQMKRKTERAQMTLKKKVKAVHVTTCREDSEKQSHGMESCHTYRYPTCKLQQALNGSPDGASKDDGEIIKVHDFVGNKTPEAATNKLMVELDMKDLKTLKQSRFPNDEQAKISCVKEENKAKQLDKSTGSRHHSLPIGSSAHPSVGVDELIDESEFSSVTSVTSRDSESDWKREKNLITALSIRTIQSLAVEARTHSREILRRYNKLYEHDYLDKKGEEQDDCHALRKVTWCSGEDLPIPRLEYTVAIVNSQVQKIMERIAIGERVGAHESMRFEILRVCTYRNYPGEDKPFRILLASAGWYYASDGDEVVCYCCGLRKSGWKEIDNPMEIHKQLRPSCDYLVRNSHVNVPIPELSAENAAKFRIFESNTSDSMPTGQSRQSEEASTSDSDNPQYRFFTPPPKHPQYAQLSARLDSFRKWPTNIPQTAQIMADCGYYYAGFGDCVRCFHCGIGLRHWTEDDYPWVEHARWSKDCAYLRQMKGEEFIQNVHLAIDNEEEPEDLVPETPSGRPADMSQTTPNEDSNQILLTDPAQSVLEMGYQPRIIKRAIDIILHNEGRSGISALKIMETIFMLEERDNTCNLQEGVANINISSASGGPDTPLKSAPNTRETESQATNETTQSVSTQSNSIGESQENAATGQTHGRSHSQGKDKTEKDQQKDVKTQLKETSKEKTESKKTPKNQDEAAAQSQNNEKQGAGKSKQKDTSKIKAENRKLKEQTICKVCLDKPVSIVFLPCGHLVTCAECAPAMKKCPICRALVKGSVKAFMS